MKILKISTVLILVILLSSFTNIPVKNMSGDDICGLWLTENNESIIKIYELKDNVYVGKVLRLSKPNETDRSIPNYGKPKIDEHSGKPMIGTHVLRNFEFDGEDTWKGRAYNPQDGGTYKCEITIAKDKNTLNVRGYLGISLFGKTQKWTRINK